MDLTTRFSGKIKSMPIIIVSLSMIFSCTNPKNDMMLTPPECDKIPHILTHHGISRTDDYYWLSERGNPEVISYLQLENEYLEASLSDRNSLKELLFSEIIGRIEKSDTSVPYFDNTYLYYSRFEDEKEYPIYCRKQGVAGQEEVLLNVNEIAAGHSYCEVSGVYVSHDNIWMVYGVDTISRRLYQLFIKNLQSGEGIPLNIYNTTGQVAWAKDNNTFFYTLKDISTLRPYKVFRHSIDGSLKDNIEVFHESDPLFTCQVSLSRSKEYILIGSFSTTTTEHRFLKADNPFGDFKTLAERKTGHEYYIDHAGEDFYIRTNLNAPNFRMMKAKENNSDPSTWLELIPHDQQVLLEDHLAFNHFFAVCKRINGLTRLFIYSTNGNEMDNVEFPESTYTVVFGDNHETNSDRIRYVYNSLTTPQSVYDYHVDDRKHELLKMENVLGGFTPSEYSSERLMINANDGIKVPVSLVYKKALREPDGNPCVLMGYGSYGYSYDPYFSISRLSLLDRGFIVAIAHVRGGQEMGRYWYETGKLLNKKNTFTDFLSCANALIDLGYTSSRHLYAMGGSAGGLLMGVIANMQPELFNGIVAMVPFVDVVTTMLDESIPLTSGEFEEWGDPKQKEYFEYMLSYSPYDNVRNGKYPAMLVTAGLHDSQVQYWEPAKWVAKLRDMKTDENPLYLFTNMEAGHGGASGRFEAYRESALIYTFLLDLEGRRE